MQRGTQVETTSGAQQALAVGGVVLVEGLTVGGLGLGDVAAPPRARPIRSITS